MVGNSPVFPVMLRVGRAKSCASAIEAGERPQGGLRSGRVRTATGCCAKEVAGSEL